jgi:hypothetical protein
MELRIGNRTTLFAHARLAESAISFTDPTDCEKVPDRVQISATTRAVVSAAIGALPGLRWSWE